MTYPTPDAIDRIGPTLPPRERVVMRQSWRHLLFLHWIVPVEQLRPLVPADLEIDTFEGRAYVGLVPFTMRGIRPVWSPPVRGLSNFHEVNVRTYVHHRGRDPGVWFFSLDAANPVAVSLARRCWHLPYHWARMSLEVSPAGSGTTGPTMMFVSERRRHGPPAGCRLRYAPRGAPSPAVPGSLDHFLAERYLLYCEKGTRLLRGRVHHEPYPLQAASLEDLEETLLMSNHLSRPAEAPIVHYASGVDVCIYPLQDACEPEKTS